MAFIYLFLHAFGAATLLPLPSEITLLLLLDSAYSPFALWLVATLGNTLGSVLNGILGRYLSHFSDRAWFPVSPTQLARAQRGFQRFGVWSLLFAWLPIVGDAFTFIAGFMRVPWWLFTVLTFIGKGGRYAFVISIYSYTM